VVFYLYVSFYLCMCRPMYICTGFTTCICPAFYAVILLINILYTQRSITTLFKPRGRLHRAVCLLTSQLSLVLTAPAHAGMARLSWPGRFDTYWDRSATYRPRVVTRVYQYIYISKIRPRKFFYGATITSLWLLNLHTPKSSEVIFIPPRHKFLAMPLLCCWSPIHVLT